MPHQPINDVVVVLPGIMGSRLADAEGHEVWGASGAALWRGIRTLGRSVSGLTLPADLGDGHPGDGVRVLGTVPDLHAVLGRWRVIDGYSGLLDWLERHFTLRRRLPGEAADAPANLVEFGYDWRLSCRYNARLLRDRVDEELGRWRASAPARRDARVTFVCHSMGGLIARYYAQCLGGHAITRRLVTIGTPHRGSVDALETLVNGHSAGPRPVRAALTRFARSLPSLHQLTPDYACLQSGKGLLYARELPHRVPGVDGELMRDAGRFHAEIREAAAARTGGSFLVPFVGVEQPTATTAAFSEDGERLTTLLTIDGASEGGDGTVPRLSAHPPGSTAGHAPYELHGSLQVNRGVRDALWNLLAPEPAYHRDPDHDPVPLRVLAPEYVAGTAPYDIAVTVPAGTPRGDELRVRATLRPAGEGGTVGRTLRNLGGGAYGISVTEPLVPGPYRVAVEAVGRPDSTVTALVLVGDGSDGERDGTDG
ncbi:esterase/lipase family protein [Streptomyces sp. NPDC058653]|uniref:esterase/lipase family protein n=1 Tax=Streptomyces sp. NPDC058653 TaxID=3346576 RepID=UPI00365ADBA1